MKYVRKVRPATAFPFILGVFSGTLISVFLFLAVRSIDELEGESLPGMEAREESETKRNLDLSSRESEPTALPPGPARDSGLKGKFLPRNVVSLNILVSKATRAFAIEKTWATTESMMRDNIHFYLLPTAQPEEEEGKLTAEMKKKMNVISLPITKVNADGGGLLIQDDIIPNDDNNNNYRGVFNLWQDVCEKKLGRYNWFVMLKDNIYLQAGKLESLLTSLNSSQPIFVGRSVKPVGYKRDELGLREGETYCFEGGYAVSWRAMEMVCPFLSVCQEGAKSENEDVELARCIREHAGINCTANSEMRDLFYVADGIIAEEELQMGVHHLNPKVKQSILLSPLYEEDHFYHVHQYLMRERLNSTKAAISQLRAHMIHTAERAASLDSLLYTSELQSPPWTRLGINAPFSAQSDDGDGLLEKVVHFQSFDDQYKYTESMHHPSSALDSGTKREMEEVLNAVMEFRAQKESKEASEGMKVSHGGKSNVMVESILQRVDPNRGIDYFMQLIDRGSTENSSPRTVFYHTLREVAPPRLTSIESPNCATIKVNFVIATPPVSRGFQRFMLSFENSFLARNPPELVSLLVILYSDGKFKKYDKDLFSVVTLLDLYRKKYPEADLRLITTRRLYSRKETVEIASKEYPSYELLFLADIHIDFSLQFIERCRMNAVENQQVYFPMVFSPYDPAEFHKSRVLHPYATKFKIGKETGAWMPESFHLVCVFNYDLSKVLHANQDNDEEEGENESNAEWNLFNEFIKFGLVKIFRSIEPGLVHLWQDGCKEEEEDLGHREKTLCERLNNHA